MTTGAPIRKSAEPRWEKYRVRIQSVPSPAWAFYDGKVDVYSFSEDEAVDSALRELRRTFPERPSRSSWRVLGVTRG